MMTSSGLFVLACAVFVQANCGEAEDQGILVTLAADSSFHKVEEVQNILKNCITESWIKSKGRRSSLLLGIAGFSEICDFSIKKLFSDYGAAEFAAFGFQSRKLVISISIKNKAIEEYLASSGGCKTHLRAFESSDRILISANCPSLEKHMSRSEDTHVQADSPADNFKDELKKSEAQNSVWGMTLSEGENHPTEKLQKREERSGYISDEKEPATDAEKISSQQCESRVSAEELPTKKPVKDKCGKKVFTVDYNSKLAK